MHVSETQNRAEMQRGSTCQTEAANLSGIIIAAYSEKAVRNYAKLSPISAYENMAKPIGMKAHYSFSPLKMKAEGTESDRTRTLYAIFYAMRRVSGGTIFALLKMSRAVVFMSL